MNQSDNIDQIAAALAIAQGEIKNPNRNRTVKVKGQSARGADFAYDFSYATLDAIIDSAKSALAKNGLSYTQVIGVGPTGKYVLITRLMHSSGQWFESQTPLLVDSSRNQEFGSALTFMRRYSLSALLGIAAEEDDDANAADGNQAEVKERKTVAAMPEAPSEPPPPKGPPHEILALVLPNGRLDWISWGQTYLAAIKADPTNRKEWETKNAVRLETMGTEAPRVFKRLNDAMEALNG